MRKAIALGLLGQLLYVVAAFAQVNRATITGTVKDPTSLVTPGVEVVAKNVDTGVVTSDVSNNVGIYTIQNLIPGRYTLTFEKPGFRTLVRRGITLESTQVAQINAQLQLGSTSQSYTVTTNSPVLQLESPSVGTNMNNQIATDLPLNIYGGGRFVEDFAVATTPGYSPISSPYGAVVNGGQWFTKDYTIDGTSATALAWDEPSGSTFLNTVNANPGINPYNDYVFCATQGTAVTGQGVVGITCPYNNFYGPALAAIAPYPQVANYAASYYFYYDLNYVGLPLGEDLLRFPVG